MHGNTLIGIGLFFIGSFALLYGTLHFPQVEFYTGGIVIGLYIAGLLYAWGNTIRQAKRIEPINNVKTVEQNPKEEAKPALSS